MGAIATRATEPYTETRERFGRLIGFAASTEASEMSESNFEREVEVQLRELKRQLLQEHLDSREGGQAAEAVVDAEGRERTVEREHERTLLTTFGPVRVRRFGYGSPGADSLHPLDGALNLPPELYSLELRRQLARAAARGSYEEAVAIIHETTGVEIPKRQAEELACRAAVDFDAFYEAKRALDSLEPAASPIVVLSLDGKGIVMRHEDLRPATRKAAEARVPKLSTRLAKGEKRNAKRMATVATVYGVDRHPRRPKDVFPVPGRARPAAAGRPRPTNKRVWASVEGEMEDVVAEAFREAESRDPEHEREWVVLVDGNDAQLRLVRATAKARGAPVITILDVIHVLEYVWKAGLTLHPEGSAALETWVLERMLRILAGESSSVAAGMRRSATLRGLANAARGAIDTCARYLLEHRRYLRYDEYLKRGYPIATGVVEGACRHLVNVRMNRSGARWTLTGAEAVLRLRALLKSGDFDEYWEFHEAREKDRNHLALYADGQMPAIHNPARRRERTHLRRVK